MSTEIKLHDHQYWIEGVNRFHSKCNSPVYGDDQGNRFCTDKNCMSSYHGIDPMEDLVPELSFPILDKILKVFESNELTDSTVKDRNMTEEGRKFYNLTFTIQGLIDQIEKSLKSYGDIPITIYYTELSHDKSDGKTPTLNIETKSSCLENLQKSANYLKSKL